MKQLNKLIDAVPAGGPIVKTKVGKFKRAVYYMEYLEQVVADVCRTMGCPLPPRCDLVTAERRRLCQDPVPQVNKGPLPQTRLEDDAVVPDLAVPRSSLQSHSKEWEIYGISQEDWMAAGSSKEQEVHGPQTAYVDVVCDPQAMNMLGEAPEVFVVSLDGCVTSVGTLLSSDQVTQQS